MENNKLSEMMQTTMGSIKNLVEVNNIVGEPIVTPDGQTIIPVSKLSFGFGGAGGDSLGSSKEGYGGGSAVGVKIEPIGFLVIKDGGVRMINVEPQAKNGVDRVIDMMPDVMDRVENIANNVKRTRLKRFNL